MQPWLFVIYTIAGALAAVWAFFPRACEQSLRTRRSRVTLHAIAIIALAPMLMVSWFALKPTVAVRLLPLTLWADYGREFWFPIAVLFFACAGRLVETRNRRALRGLAIFLAIFVAVATAWHLRPPASYDLGRNMTQGVCMQSTGYTCGAASLVTMLDAMGIEASEGEMARLSRTIPGRGVSDFQAAAGLQRKLDEIHSNTRVEFITRPDGDPTGITPPFLAGIKYSMWFDHMVCVLELRDNAVVIGDSLQGRRLMTYEQFAEEWRGVAIMVTATQ